MRMSVSIGARLRVTTAEDLGLTEEQLDVVRAVFLHCDQHSGLLEACTRTLAEMSGVHHAKISRILVELNGLNFIRIGRVRSGLLEHRLVANLNQVGERLDLIREKKHGQAEVGNAGAWEWPARRKD